MLVVLLVELVTVLLLFVMFLLRLEMEPIKVERAVAITVAFVVFLRVVSASF